MKKIFISGASSGIGKSVAILAAKAGFEVGFSYNKSEKEAAILKKEIDSITKCSMFKCDFNSVSDVKKLADEISSEMGGVDYLVNNAGISLWGVFQDVSEKEFDEIMNVDFKSLYYLTSKLSESMIKNRYGSIVNISSVWGETGASCEVLYSSIKAAVIGFTKSLAKELAPSNVRVNSVSPGVVDTRMMNIFSDNEKKEIASDIPLMRFAKPEEIAEAVLFLISDKASYITGENLSVNGGMYC